MSLRRMSVVLSLCLMFGVPDCRLAQAKDPRQAVPSIASIARIKVGLDTRRTMERRLGPGEVLIGGHPRGARLWRWKQAGWFIHADAFDYSRGGVVINEVTIYSAAGWPALAGDLPKVSLSRKELSLLGVISLGMSKKEVLGLAKTKLPPPEIKGDTILWKVSGFVRLNEQQAYDTWEAELTFINDRLEKISIGC